MASIGEFIHGGEGFRITEPVTLTPMLNVLCNLEGFACEVSQNGMPSGSFKYEDGETATLISGSNCALYLRDDCTGDIWCIGSYPHVSSVENYCCEHYAAYTRISSTHDGIDATLRLFVPDDFKGIVFTLTVANHSGRTRRLSHHSCRCNGAERLLVSPLLRQPGPGFLGRFFQCSQRLLLQFPQSLAEKTRLLLRYSVYRRASRFLGRRAVRVLRQQHESF